jgi:hypothetical protein
MTWDAAFSQPRDKLRLEAGSQPRDKLKAKGWYEEEGDQLRWLWEKKERILAYLYGCLLFPLVHLHSAVTQNRQGAYACCSSGYRV